ncbi:hypothetical protein [Microcoleus anatoxicus]|uniref:Uncharacterized protein n=1 Tax=Microcoleus anatoxicus PTRS2 TaxID=2705321 RepID=A0ABU8YSV1_9CYAN
MNIANRNIRLIGEDLAPYDTVINCSTPLPKFLIDGKGNLFVKRTIFESGQSRVVYSQALATHLTSVEVSDCQEVESV